MKKLLFTRFTGIKLPALCILVSILATSAALAAKPGGGGGGGTVTPSYSYQTLGTDYRTVLSAMNSSGVIVGDSGSRYPLLIVPLDTKGDGQPDCWFKDDNADGVNDLIIDIGLPHSSSPAPQSGTTCINEAGQVAGVYVSPSEFPEVVKFFVVTPRDLTGDGKLEWVYPDGQGGNAFLQIIRVGAGYNGSDPWVSGFNRAGQLLVQMYKASWVIPGRDTDGDGLADLWYEDADRDGQNDFRRPLGMARSSSGAVLIASGRYINEAGQVIGVLASSISASGGEAFVLDPVMDPVTGELTWFVPTPDGLNSLVRPLGGPIPDGIYDANEAGAIAGQVLTTGGYTHAALWRPGLQGWSFTDLGLFGTMNSTAAFGVNDLGQVVGSAQQIKGGKTVAQSPFIWQNGVYKDLRPMLDKAASLGATSLGPRGINDSGVIFGSSTASWWVAVPIAK